MDDELSELAAAHGVATGYRGGDRRPVTVDDDVVVRVLALLDVDASTPHARRIALAAAREQAATGALPGTIAARTDRSRPLPAAGVLIDEAGGRRDVTEIPAGLEPGWYRLETGDREVTVVVAPPSLPDPERSWGWMLQLYALHSQGSWGIGDLGDLREFTAWTGREHGAGAVLLNPLHAFTPVPPVQPSPYTPSSRRFGTPLALRITDLDAYRDADGETRAEIDALRPAMVSAASAGTSPSAGSSAASAGTSTSAGSSAASAGTSTSAGSSAASAGTSTSAGGERIEHDRVWAAKRSALELLWRAAGRPEWVAKDTADADLAGFATFCALAERFGGRWSRWPAELRRPGAAPADLAPRVAFHTWVQVQVQAQLAAVRDSAREHGVRIIHDLAVGCDPEGADAWAWADVLALGVHVGAPPDAFSQQGQDWGLPPWRPDRLDATGYAAYRDLLRAQLRQADGLRIDHVAGLWRLWWVPPGESADRGTYVRYDAEVMLAVLTLEAHRAGALVIGEDLGTVEPEVTEGLAERHMLGSSVLWFTRDSADAAGRERPYGDAPGVEPLLSSQRWSEDSVATISTHDLPTAMGFLTGEHVRVRAELGLLDDVAAEEGRAAADRAELVALLEAEGFAATGADDAELVVAMHAFLAATRSRLALVSPYDVIGEVRQPNLPGTVDEYPNWRLPLPVSLEELRDDPRVAAVVDVMRRSRG